MSNRIFDKTFDALAKTLDLRSQKQNVISANIANADTPGYQAQRIDFEESLANALNLGDVQMLRTDERHMSSGGPIQDVEPEIYNSPNNVVKQDGNTVDRDAEMVQLAENQIMYQTAADLLRKRLGMLKYVISDGGSH